MRMACLYAFCFLPLLAAAQKKHGAPIPVAIQWVNKLNGDFSFRHKWSYEPGITLNACGQLYYEMGFPAADSLLGKNYCIPQRSLKTYYSLVDTIHLYRSISCNGWCYEMGDVNYAEAEQRHDTLHCYTLCDAATHCSLNLVIVGDTCYAFILLRSVRPGPGLIYYSDKGSIKIDRSAIAKNTLKAEFDLTFASNARTQMFWKGRIYKKVQPAGNYNDFWSYRDINYEKYKTEVDD